MIVVDVETSGLDPQKNSILSIGAVEFCNPKNQFYTESQLFDGAEVSDSALRINGFSRESIFDPSKPTVESAVKQFLEWASRCPYRTLAGENPTFDKDFLRASAERYNVEWRLGRRLVDLHSISYTKHLELNKIPPLQNGVSELKADATYSFVGIPEEPTPHNALNGAKWEAEAFSRLLCGHWLFEEFQTFPVPDYLLK
ncbi:MAG TPA: 3'-5' exonuclease [Candidatus Nanoarchaeia archaeon]|nr:3'-5' exonuclease [Candidatus Nanoarchaeia archaeon]